MRQKLFAAFLLACAVAAPAHATPFTVAVADAQGRRMANAVVALTPNEASHMPAASSVLPQTQIIDQRNEMFMPLVSVIPSGGAIQFTNSDRTMHHVYSFAPIRQFEFVLNAGEKSSLVRFDHSGIAAVGCNIHDQMITYVYVTDSPWTALTGADGLAHFDVPAGAYRTSLWHPELAPGREVPATSIVVGNAPGQVTLTMPRLPNRNRNSSHRGDY